MITNIKEKIIRVIILDVSSVYAQIHNQGYFSEQEVEEIKKQYSDTEHWRVFVLDKIIN